MKTLSAITLASALTFGGASVAAAQEMDITPATLDQIDAANVAVIEEVDATFEPAGGPEIDEVRQAINTDPSFDTLLENADLDVQNIVEVAYNDDGSLMFYVTPLDSGFDNDAADQG